MTNEEKAMQIRTLQREEESGEPAWLYYEGILTVLEQKGAWSIEVIKDKAGHLNLDW